MECDGCGVNPIVGIRFKCSVRQNFDYCAECEERLDHEHPFLKIRKPAHSPAFMCTVLPEDAPEGKDQDNLNNNMPNFAGMFGGPWMKKGGPHGGRGGHHGHGHGPHGHGGHGGRGGGHWMHKIGKFMEHLGVDPTKVEEAAQ